MASDDSNKDGGGSKDGDSSKGGDISSVDYKDVDPRLIATYIGKLWGVSKDVEWTITNTSKGSGGDAWGAYSGDDGTTANWQITLPQYGGWTVHDTASSAHKQLADAIDKTVADLTSSLDKLMEQWQGTPIPHIKSSMETFISSVQTLAHSVYTASKIHSRQSQMFKELYSYSSEKNSYTLQPSGPDVGQWRFVPSAYEMNCLHKIFAGGSWYDWFSPWKWGMAIDARIRWNAYSSDSHNGYQAFIGDSAGNANPSSFGSVPQIPKLTNSGGGSGGGSGSGTGGGGSFVNELASLLPSLLLAPMSAMGMLSGLAGGLGKGTTGGNTLAGAQDPTPGAGSDASAWNSPSPGLIGTRVPNKSDLPSAFNGFRFTPGWDGQATPTSSTPASGDATADRATAQRPSDNASPIQGGGMPAMMPPMMGNRGSGGGQENSSSRSGLQKETAPIFTSDKDLPFSDDEWSTIITNLSGPSSNIELPNPNIPYMQRDH